jgi:hypothetical protein
MVDFGPGPRGGARRLPSAMHAVIPQPAAYLDLFLMYAMALTGHDAELSVLRRVG